MNIKVKVIPNASQNAIIGFENDTLKVKLTAVPEKGLANKALIGFLSKSLKIPKSTITILKGETSSSKTLRIDDLVKDDVLNILSQLPKINKD